MAAIEHMMLSNRAGAAILHTYAVHAATDVTGFGLLGHLVEMVKASDVDVTLQLPAVPLLEGLREIIALGIFSSLQPQNVRMRRAIDNLDRASIDPLYPALFDPQTAGGLLAALPQANADACLRALRAAGYAHAAVIGTVQAKSVRLEAITIAFDIDNTTAYASAANRVARSHDNELEKTTCAHAIRSMMPVVFDRRYRRSPRQWRAVSTGGDISGGAPCQCSRRTAQLAA